MVDLAQVGAFPSDPTAAGVPVRFGVALPGIGAGFQVRVLVIHAADRFAPTVLPQSFDLHSAGTADGLWSATVTVTPAAGTSFGLAGRYLYRFQLLSASGTVLTPWFTDPFARDTDDVGQLCAFDTPASVPDFAWHDGSWKTPELADLVVYELHVEEFNATFDGVVDRLPYLRSLGVTCLELMPVTSLKLDFDWGYGPLHYFAANQRWGGRAGLKRLVDACHAAGVAVILDLVLQHVDPAFPYHQVYLDAGVVSPMIGADGDFGPTIDYSQQFARDYVATLTGYLLEEYHVDGFRYDEVTDLYDGPEGVEYASFAYEVYDASLSMPRFTPSGGGVAGEYSRVIQVPEALTMPQDILRFTYSTGTWQDNLLNKVEDMARSGYVDDGFAHLLDIDFSGYPASKTVHDALGTAIEMPVAPFQYLNSHDHSHLVAFASPAVGEDVALADRQPWFRIQPFVVAQLTASGTPMLWQGQELTDNYVLAGNGDLRIHFRRDLHWEYFYDPYGNPLVRLHRRLGVLRAGYAVLRGRESFYYNEDSRTADGVIAYRRGNGPDAALVFLNFSGSARTMSVPFPATGTWREQLDDPYRAAPLDLSGSAGEPMTVTVPSSYGCVFTPLTPG